MVSITLVLLIAALVCFLLAACSVPTGRISLGWLGMAFLTITRLVS